MVKTGTTLITGASGFIGRAVLARLMLEGDARLRGAVRLPVPDMPSGVEPVLVADLAPDTDWCRAVSGATAGKASAPRHRPSYFFPDL